MLERRRDPRTQTFLPVKMTLADNGEERPAHLMDLSYGGAGVQTTAYNAPVLGEYVDLDFETPTSDGGTERSCRRETGMVVNVAAPEHGIRRIGVRFLQHPGLSCGMFDPNDLLLNHRKMVEPTASGNRWETARSFEKFSSTPAMAGAT